jgi:hypothetical protein
MSDEYVEEEYKPQTEEEKRKERISNAQEFFTKQAAKKSKATTEKKIPGTGFTSAIGNTPVVGSADVGSVDVGCVGDMCTMFGGIKLKSKKNRKMKRKSSKRRRSSKRRTNKRRK